MEHTLQLLHTIYIYIYIQIDIQNFHTLQLLHTIYIELFYSKPLLYIYVFPIYIYICHKGHRQMVETTQQITATSIWALANVITDRVVVTGHEHIATVTNNPSTSDPPRVPPHNLSIVPAYFTNLACVRGVPIILLFIRPGPYCISRSPCIAVTPIYILPQLEPVLRKRMLHLAVSSPLPCPPFGVVFQVEVPCKWQLPFGCPHQIVGKQEFQRLGHAAPAQLLGNPVYGLVVGDFPASFRLWK